MMGFAHRTVFFAMFYSITSCGGDKQAPEPKKEVEPEAKVVASLLSVMPEEGYVRSGDRDLRSGDQVFGGSIISVSAGGSALLSLEGGKRLAVDAGTNLTMDAGSKVTLAQGRIWIETSPSTTPSTMVVGTPEAVVTLEGTAGAITSSDGELKVEMVSGRARVTRTDEQTVVAGGQSLVVTREGDAELSYVHDAGRLVAWTEGLRKAIVVASEQGETPWPVGPGTLTAKTALTGKQRPFDILSHRVRIDIVDGFAFTEVEQIFHNPSKEIVEGLYKFPLPPGATLNRYAMQIQDRLMEGEIVARQRGRIIMSDVKKQFVDLMRDPALVEWESGTTFKTRIFPILGNQDKRILLSYVQTLPCTAGQCRYVLHMASAGTLPPAIPELDISATVSSSTKGVQAWTPLYPASVEDADGTAKISFEARDLAPTVDFVIELKSVGATSSMATFSGKEASRKLPKPGEGKPVTDDSDYFTLSMTVDPGQQNSVVAPGDWILLVDTSQSRTEFDGQIQASLVETIVGTLSIEDRVRVIAYDEATEAMTDDWTVPSESLATDARSFLDGRALEGATNLLDALRAAAAFAAEGSRPRIVLIGDGAATLGETRPGRLVEEASEALTASGGSVTTIGVGSSVDHIVLDALARATGGRSFSVSSGEDLLTAAVRIVAALRTPIVTDATLTFEGIEVFDVHPGTLSNLGPGEDLQVTGRYRGTGAATVTLNGKVSGAPYEQTASFDISDPGTKNSFIPMIWAAGKLDSLAVSNEEDAISRSIALSQAFSLACRHTSFIVLEDESMYEQYGVKQDDERLDWTGSQGIDYQQSTTGAAQEPRYSGGTANDDLLSALLDGSGPSMSKPSAMSKPPDPLDDPIGGGKKYYKTYTWVQVGSVKLLPEDLEPDEAKKRIQEATLAVQSDALDREARRKLVDLLRDMGRTDEALEAVVAWNRMDRGNASALGRLAELRRLQGKPTDAQRAWSGLIDVDPSNRMLLDRIAGMLESRGQWSDAYPYRLARLLLRTSSGPAAADAVITAARAGRKQEARDLAMEFLLETKKDKLVFRKNTMLKPAARDLVMAVAASQPLSEPTSFKPGQSTVIVRLTWEGDTDLDLLVTDTDGNLLGAGKGNLYLATGEETAFVQVEEGGRWEVSVVCGADGGCPTTKASVSIKAADAKETIPVLLKGSVGTEVARIIVKQKQVVSSSTYNVMPGVSTRARPDKNEIIALLKPLVPKVKACAQGVEGVVKVSITFMGSTGKISPASVSGGPELTPAQKSCIESVVLKAGKLEPFEDAKLKVVFPFALK